MMRHLSSEIELGNLLFGHSRGKFRVDRKYQDRFVRFLEQIGCDSYGCREDSDEFGCSDLGDFIVRPYYWGYDESRFSLPNFECKSLGLELSWYKYPLRDSFSNIEFTDEIMDNLEESLITR